MACIFENREKLENNLYFNLNEYILVDITFLSFKKLAFKNPLFLYIFLSSNILAMVGHPIFP